MRATCYFFSCLLLFSFTLNLHAECNNCCARMGGIYYCDSSSGRYVCQNGDYSNCYCTRHAVMDLQKLEGCCLWQGGVLKIDPNGFVVCNNGGLSEICSIRERQAKEPISSF